VIDLRRTDRPLAIGHRGAKALAPENTLAAFEAAAATGVDAIEFDVLRGPDGELVLGHSLDELPEELFRFEDALAWFATHEERLHVDVKADDVEAEVVDGLRRHGVLERAYVSSTDAPVLRRFAEIEPSLPRALTYPEDRLGISRHRGTGPLVSAGLAVARALLPHRIASILRGSGATVASLEHRVVTAAVVRHCHAAGLPVVTWTVNEPERVRELVALGVDGIVSDDPRIFAATLSAS
jgi:glycerophosphoryl diester phosphodiesterase